jgi:hypothetical protein
LIGNSLSLGDHVLYSNSSSDDVRSIVWIHSGRLYALLVCKVDATRKVVLQDFPAQLNYSKIDNSISFQTPIVQEGKINSANPLSFEGYTVILLESAV